MERGQVGHVVIKICGNIYVTMPEYNHLYCMKYN